MNWISKLQNKSKEIPIWKKYSQSNEESYIEYILGHVGVDKKILEIGAWDGYHLSNTRYFIEKGYDALLFDGDNKGNNEVKEHFILKENIVPLLRSYAMPLTFDLLCIDVDGNDLYILEEMLTNGYKPRLIVAEFNPIFKVGESYTIKYNPEHRWNNDNFYGFSFSAGIKLGEKYGYTCIFQNDNLNMYFLENSLIDGLNVLTPKYDVTFYHPKSAKKDWVQY